MKLVSTLLAAAIVAPVLLFPVAAVSLVIVAGLAALVASDYGQSAGSSYAVSTVAAEATVERLPLAV